MKSLHDKLLVFIAGPTAVGKTALCISLAKRFNTDIISADSRQFYREMTIGTAKPTPDELAEVKHHLIDSHSITEEYNVMDFEKNVLKISADLFQHKDILFVTGGSGLYLQAIWHGFDDNLPHKDESLRAELETLHREKGLAGLQEMLSELDPVTYAGIDKQNHVRLMRAIEVCKLSNQPASAIRKGESKERPFRMLKIGLELPREELYARINERVDNMIVSGLVEEVHGLQFFRNKNALNTLGYRELFRYFDGELTLEQAVEKIKINSRRYAKRQMTWFRRYTDIAWFHPDEIEKIERYINSKQT